MMRRSKVLAKLRSGGLARISATGHFLPFFIRHSARFNYDGIWLDLEHRTMDDREVQAFIAACYYNDIDCMVRTPTLERSRLYHYLDDGATGFMVPFVSTPEMARQVVDATKFPPLGNRGIDGAGLDGDYGIEAWKPDATYYEDANRETFILAQIETPEAVQNVDKIAAVPGIDCLFIGPGDLGYRLSVTQSPLNIDEAMERVIEAARRHGKAWGRTAGTFEELAAYRKMGAQIVPWGGDFALVKVLQQCSQELASIPVGG
jgi:2-keto-3-deoxy-L-rhamnonate aldolase RhmA